MTTQMFDMVKTHFSANETGTDTKEVYRDREAGVTVIHHSAHRGGCLYLGDITVLNLNNGARFTFTSTAGPDPDDRETRRVYLAGIAAKHWSKVQ
jgi:hypothetical protein